MPTASTWKNVAWAVITIAVIARVPMASKYVFGQ